MFVDLTIICTDFFLGSDSFCVIRVMSLILYSDPLKELFLAHCSLLLKTGILHPSP